MVGKCHGILAILSVIVLLLASCNLGAPDLALRIVNPTIAPVVGDPTNVRITYQLHNSGSETLRNCKVRWYVDDTSGTDIEYDEITNWTPTTGYDLSVDETSEAMSVETTSGIFAGGSSDSQSHNCRHGSTN